MSPAKWVNTEYSGRDGVWSREANGSWNQEPNLVEKKMTETKNNGTGIQARGSGREMTRV